MLILKSVSEMQSQIAAMKAAGKVVSFVPTMGALHRGHLSLVDIAKKHGSYVVMSIFVNPTQFNAENDLINYPRTLEEDTAQAKAAGVDVLFMPAAEEIYPAGLAAYRAGETVKIIAGKRSRGLCGATRPGHFDGVATVVSLLFHIVQPDVAVFGEKDYQQAKVIAELVRDQHFPVKLVLGPTVRDEDGLALSSRNLRLNKDERAQALAIPKVLERARAMVVEKRERSVQTICQLVREELGRSGIIKVDYVEVVDTETLEPLKEIIGQAQLVVAAFVGDVRLIDNVRLAE